MILHAGCVARRTGGGWAGVLITGASGSGKSDLALRLVAGGWRLVADDRAVLWSSSGGLFAAAPEPLSGLIEARGVGILTLPPLAFAPVRLAVRCLSPGEAGERLPDPAERELAGVLLPAVSVNALEASAAVKLELALARQGRFV